MSVPLVAAGGPAAVRPLLGCVAAMQPRGACSGGGPRTAPAVALSRLAAAVVVAVAMAVVAGGGTPAFAWSPTAPHDAAVAATAAAAAGAVPWGGVGLPPLHPLDRQSSPEPTATPLPPRSEVPKNATWALEVVFATPAAFDAEATALNDLSADGTWPTLLAFRGTLAAAGPAGVVALYDELFALQRRVEVLWVYAQMQLHTDLADDAKKAAAGRAGAIRSSFEQAISWVGPELLALPPDAAATLVASPALSAANLTATVQSILRAAPHTLSAEGELVLQLVDRSKAAVEGAFGALSNADMAFPPIRDVAGVVHPVTQGNYGGHMRSRDRVRREAAFKSFTGEYNAHINTLAEVCTAEGGEAGVGGMGGGPVQRRIARVREGRWPPFLTAFVSVPPCHLTASCARRQCLGGLVRPLLRRVHDFGDATSCWAGTSRLPPRKRRCATTRARWSARSNLLPSPLASTPPCSRRYGRPCQGPCTSTPPSARGCWRRSSRAMRSHLSSTTGT